MNVTFTEDNDYILDINGDKAYPLFVVDNKQGRYNFIIYHGIYYWCNNKIYILDNSLVLYQHISNGGFDNIHEFADTRLRYFIYSDISKKYETPLKTFENGLDMHESRLDVLSYINDLILNEILERL